MELARAFTPSMMELTADRTASKMPLITLAMEASASATKSQAFCHQLFLLAFCSALRFSEAALFSPFLTSESALDLALENSESILAWSAETR